MDEGTKTLISREALKEQIKTELANVPRFEVDSEFSAYSLGVVQGLKLAETIIDNAPTVEMPNDVLKAYHLGYAQAKVDLERPQGEWVRKEDVIHSIAKQYSEHNELVPIWLSIGDMR